MSTQVQLRRGTTSQHSTFTGALAEVTVDTDKKTLVVHDGVTPGGTPLLTSVSVIAITAGGTGANNAADARTNLGLGNVDNTSDANKPVSTATQTALNLKANLTSPALTGTPTAPTATAGTNTTQIATTAFVIANSSPMALLSAVSLSGTSTDITFPSNVQKIEITMSGLRGSSGSNAVLQLVRSGTPETTGAIGGVSDFTATSVATATLSTNINLTGSNTSSSIYSVIVNLVRHDGNKWIVSATSSRTDASAQKTSLVVSEKTLASALTGVRVTFANGTDTFQSGGTIAAKYWTA